MSSYHAYNHLLVSPPRSERRVSQALPFEPMIATPLYERAKRSEHRAGRALMAVESVLTLMEHPMVVWKLKGKTARGGVTLMADDAFAPPELSARMAATELQALRVRLITLLKSPEGRGDGLNQVPFSVEESMNVLHAIRREAAAHLRQVAQDETFHELKNLCQLALGNLQQMSFARVPALA